MCVFPGEVKGAIAAADAGIVTVDAVDIVGNKDRFEKTVEFISNAQIARMADEVFQRLGRIFKDYDGGHAMHGETHAHQIDAISENFDRTWWLRRLDLSVDLLPSQILARSRRV